MLYAYPMIIKPQDDGYYLAESPDLKGVVVGGDNLPELIQAASDGCAMWLTDAEDNAEAIPVPSEPAQIALQAGEYVSVVVADTDVYRRMNSNKTVKKTVSLPESLAYAADRAGLSLSKVLQDTLATRLGISP